MKLRAPIVFILSAVAVVFGQPPERASKPDIFLVTIDTVRADHVHCYGYQDIQTPALDRLARDGLRFANAFTVSPITNTSHTSILTGLLPTHHGVTDFGMPLSATHPTAASLLREHGYHTAAFIASVVLDSHSLAPGLDQGFDYYDNFPVHSATKSRWGRLERRAMTVVGRTESWLATHSTRPRFVWMHFYDPHDPYEPPEPFSTKYKGHLYDGEIAYADSALSSFIGYLKAHGWYEDAVILVVGDHGEGLGQHREDTHGIFLYDSTIHVPLILKMPAAPSITKGRVIQSQVRTTDILPTLLRQAGSPAPSNLDGQPLQELIYGDEPVERPAFAETDYPMRFGWAPLRSVRSGEFKFIEAPRPELYDIRSDSGEVNNRYAPWDPQTQRLRQELAKMHLEAQRASSPAAVSQETVDELRALGYLGRLDAGSVTNVPVPSFLPDPKDRVEEQNLLHAAMTASEDGRIDFARVALLKVIEMDRNSALALRLLGELELQAGEYGSAAQHLGAVLRLEPEDPSAALLAAKAMEKNNELEDARAAAEQSLKLAPSQFDARMLLGRILLEAGNSTSAEDEFQAALLLSPGSESAILALAEVQISEGKLSEAVRELQSCPRSRNPRIFDLLAEALDRSGQGPLAKTAKRHAQQLRTGQR